MTPIWLDVLVPVVSMVAAGILVRLCIHMLGRKP